MKHSIIISIVLLAAAVAQAADSRPNIMFFFADDWGCYASAYRKVDGENSIQSVVNTPNFDRIAREGVLFTHAHVTAPSCTPCRSSLLSGQYFFRTGMGAILSGAKWDPAIPSYPLILRDKGYHIGHSYKVWSPGTPVNAPYGGLATGYIKAGGDINHFGHVVMQAKDKQAKAKEIYKQVVDNFDAFMKDGKPGQPWCFWYGPTETHRPYAWGSGQAFWGINPDNLKGKLPAFLPDNETIRTDVADYLGEAQSFDASVGALMKRLEETGQLDNTLIVISGDHGIGGMPRAKCNLYDFGTHVALAARWPGKIPPGRTVDDFVNLMDLCPTFIEAGGEKPLPVMTGKSLMPVLLSDKSGQVDPERTFVITGRERHVNVAREGNLPYPMRSIETKDFLYVHNFKPDRWPMGTPTGPGKGKGGDAATDTYVAFPDMDASPTKAWMIAHQLEPLVKPLFDLAFGKRPGEELYDLRKDPDQMNNLVGVSEYEATRKKLEEQLMAELTRAKDPRVLGDGSTFDKPPYAGTDDAANPAPKGKGKKAAAKPGANE